MMKSILKHWKLFLTVLLANSLIAVDVDGFVVHHLDQNAPAPIEGFLFTPQKTEEFKTCILTSKSLQISLALCNEDKSNLEKKAQILSDVQQSHDLTNLERIMWFAAGALGVGLATYGLARITRQ